MLAYSLCVQRIFISTDDDANLTTVVHYEYALSSLFAYGHDEWKRTMKCIGQ